jgi:hypothetical protein
VRDLFRDHARCVGVQAGDDWTVEQICEALVDAEAPWPASMTNEQGWQLWTAVMRRRIGVKAIMWDEVPRNEGAVLEVAFRF